MFEQVFQLTPANLPLDQLYLDPNNPRFSEDARPHVSDDLIDQDGLQSELMSKMETEYAVDRLKDSMESNGYLPIDRIVVRQFKEDKYVVLEGNRRITAAKRLSSQHQRGDRILDPQVLETLENVPSLVYSGDDSEAAWVFQGIRHISGIKDWSAYNKAKLLVDQMEDKNLSYTDAGKIFGISAWAAAQRARGYYAYQRASEHPDYHNDVDTRSFPFFQELFGRSNVALRDEWLIWDESSKNFADQDNFAEFLSWLYPKFDDQGEYDPDLPGDWEKRWIRRAIDLRDVNRLYSRHPSEFRAFRQPDVSLSTAQGRAAAKEEERERSVEDYLEEIDNLILDLEDLPLIKIINEEKADLVLEKVAKLSDILATLQNVLKRNE
jgi:hypothetical protein